MNFEDMDIVLIVMANLNIPYEYADGELFINNKSYKMYEYKKSDDLIRIIKNDNNIT